MNPRCQKAVQLKIIYLMVTSLKESDSSVEVIQLKDNSYSPRKSFYWASSSQNYSRLFHIGKCPSRELITMNHMLFQIEYRFIAGRYVNVIYGWNHRLLASCLGIISISVFYRKSSIESR